MSDARKSVVVGQPVPLEKRLRARELRHDATLEERLLWQHLRANRLRGLHFRRQQAIAGFIVDFYCHSEGLVVELDGEVHIGREDYDFERDAVLGARGLRVLRFANAQVRDSLAEVLDEIVTLCDPTHLSGMRFRDSEE